MYVIDFMLFIKISNYICKYSIAVKKGVKKSRFRHHLPHIDHQIGSKMKSAQIA